MTRISDLPRGFAQSLHTSRGRSHAKAKGSTWSIEGELVSVAEIAKRTGRTHRSASLRLRDLRSQEGPITWEKLACSVR